MSASDLILTRGGLRFEGRLWPCVIGRGGVRADKREGDGATPVGTHRIVAMLYRPDRMARPASWATPIGLRDLWCDDVSSAAYNQLVEAPFAPSHETMRRADPLYDLVLITDWNWPEAEAGCGSAIFLHQWRRPGYPTAGCIGFDPADLRRIAARLKPGARLVVPAPLDGWRTG